MPHNPKYSLELRAIRDRMGLLQSEMGALLGVDVGSVGRYERGNLPVPEPVIRLARALVRLSQRDRQS
jgi:transcriptional regulator with XRE-family HTH domain